MYMYIFRGKGHKPLSVLPPSSYAIIFIHIIICCFIYCGYPALRKQRFLPSPTFLSQFVPSYSLYCVLYWLYYKILARAS